jgi:hypothetical protein
MMLGMSPRNPLPGMNPWLEEHWGDIHHRIVLYCCDQIAQRLPGDLFAAVEETVYISGEDLDAWRVRPDVGVFGLETEARPAGWSGPVTATLAKPTRIRYVRQPVVEGHIEIRKFGEGEPLVTAIEVFSPTNKIDRRGRRAYLNKREAYHDGKVNIVEIDLLRAGEQLIDISLDELAPDQVTPYKACVLRAVAAEVDMEAEYYPFALRQRLPAIAIPLRRSDADIPLDLQAPIDLAYERGRYAVRIDYAKPPKPPLSPEDAEWAAEAVKSAVA